MPLEYLGCNVDYDANTITQEAKQNSRHWVWPQTQ